jgi:hypothetical protein
MKGFIINIQSFFVYQSKIKIARRKNLIKYLLF